MNTSKHSMLFEYEFCKRGVRISEGVLYKVYKT